MITPEVIKQLFTGVAVHQGDVQLYQLKSLPEGLRLVSKQLLAKSERSGAAHALFGNYDVYEVEEGDETLCVIDIKEDCVLNHSMLAVIEAHSPHVAEVLEKKDHAPTILKTGIYYAGPQQRFDPLAGLKTNVKD